jgi:hypothetical protein
MPILDSQVVVPDEAWAFTASLGMEQEFAELLALTRQFYHPVAELVVEYTPFDPTFKDEQMLAKVAVLPGGRIGSDADREWIDLVWDRFPRPLLTRITTVSYPFEHPSDAAHARS